MWILWREKNERAFNDVEHADQVIKSFFFVLFMFMFMDWGRVYIKGSSVSMNEFMNWLSG